MVAGERANDRTRPITLWSVARRPGWIAALLATLAFAAGFVLLSQWQVSRSVQEATVVQRDTETVVALESIAEPQAAFRSDASGRVVSVDVTFVRDDYGILTGRRHDGTDGYWLTAHGVVRAGEAEGASLAVALGWAPTMQQAKEAINGIGEPGILTGRYVPSEAPQENDFESGTRRAMAVPALINEWDAAPAGVYSGYLIADTAPTGLETIVALAPVDEVVLNWLNVFYAIEWVVFAGFALFLWYRFVRDAWEREVEEADELN